MIGIRRILAAIIGGTSSYVDTIARIFIVLSSISLAKAIYRFIFERDAISQLTSGSRIMEQYAFAQKSFLYFLNSLLPLSFILPVVTIFVCVGLLRRRPWARTGFIRLLQLARLGLVLTFLLTVYFVLVLAVLSRGPNVAHILFLPLIVVVAVLTFVFFIVFGRILKRFKSKDIMEQFNSHIGDTAT